MRDKITEIQRQLLVEYKGPLPLLRMLFFCTVIIIWDSSNSTVTQESFPYWTQWSHETPHKLVLGQDTFHLLRWVNIKKSIQQWPKPHSVRFIYSFKGWMPSFTFLILPPDRKNHLNIISVRAGSSVSERRALSIHGLPRLKVQYITWDFNIPNYALFEFQKECSS